MLMTKDSKNQQNYPVRPPLLWGGRLGRWGTAGEIVAAVTGKGGCPNFGEIRQNVSPRGGDRRIVLTRYQSLMTASPDMPSGNLAPGSRQRHTTIAVKLGVSIAVAQHPAKRETRSISI